MIKYLGTFLLLMSLSGCNYAAWEAYNHYPEQSGPFNAEVHPCVNIEDKAALLWDTMQGVKKEEEKDAIINYLQRQVKQDPSMVIMQAGAELLYETEPMPEKGKFMEAAKDVCIKRFGSIMDRSHV